MKKIIIILGTIILAICIFGLILGDDTDSIKTNTKSIFQELVNQQKTTP